MTQNRIDPLSGTFGGAVNETPLLLRGAFSVLA